MKTWLALAMLVLCGCGGGEAALDDNHGHGWSYDVQGVSGLKLRYMPVMGPGFGDVSTYEGWFSEVRTCTGIDASAPPFVIYVDRDSLGTNADGVPIRGRYFDSPSLILLEPALLLELKANFKHETVHYLLDISTGNPDSNHVSPFFKECAGF